MKWDIVIHEFTCDGCSNAETTEVDELPAGWIQYDENTHFCPNCQTLQDASPRCQVLS